MLFFESFGDVFWQFQVLETGAGDLLLWSETLEEITGARA